ncbi:MAG: H-type lectin domain-containing protein [Litoreibacter sp.]|nr:H-type lectin domain-containing protein [Litoreibacter sp.]MCY4336049.1 H-type lectin domain-containing protein [Litoreibacter sp.]
MHKLQNAKIGICQGERVLFSDYANDGPMWVGTGPRAHNTDITFDERFLTAPALHVGLTMWDIDNAQNQRVDISAEEITEAGFALVFKTWGDSRIARVRASWMAIGALPHDDDWELY